eukprot:c10362_g1_i1.p1 GENE.c10362_g1_i1~~c10362_g1_i1.p1  ORF type:complete len:274 (+),score=68.08 c10362_g1_i1:54-824(+)
MENEFELVSDMVTGCRLILYDMEEYALYKFVVYAGHGTCVEHVGETFEMQEAINMNPKTAKELEQTIDTLIWRDLRTLDETIPGLANIVGKMAPNQYNVGDKVIHLNLQRGGLVVRVGGGYMEFSAWIMKHRYSIMRFMASTAQSISSKPHAVPTMVRHSAATGSLQTAPASRKHQEILEKGSQPIQDAAFQSQSPFEPPGSVWARRTRASASASALARRTTPRDVLTSPRDHPSMSPRTSHSSSRSLFAEFEEEE